MPHEGCLIKTDRQTALQRTRQNNDQDKPSLQIVDRKVLSGDDSNAIGAIVIAASKQSVPWESPHVARNCSRKYTEAHAAPLELAVRSTIYRCAGMSRAWV